MGDRSAKARFGSDRHWTLPDGREIDVGEAVTSAGPGEGFALLPWALDTYERVLGLRPEDTWLLKRMLKHAWEPDTPVFLSLHKITREASITRNRLRRIMARLVELGYIEPLDPAEGDQRRRYSVQGIYNALALCVALDPRSEWAKEHGALTPEQVRGLCPSPNRVHQLDVDALPRRNGHAVAG